MESRSVFKVLGFPFYNVTIIRFKKFYSTTHRQKRRRSIYPTLLGIIFLHLCICVARPLKDCDNGTESCHSTECFEYHCAEPDISCGNVSKVICPTECEDGYRGLSCNETCVQFTYGKNCSLPCSPTCVDKFCDHVSGRCTSGCIGGYSGDTCAFTATFVDSLNVILFIAVCVAVVMLFVTAMAIGVENSGKSTVRVTLLTSTFKTKEAPSIAASKQSLEQAHGLPIPLIQKEETPNESSVDAKNRGVAFYKIPN